MRAPHPSETWIARAFGQQGPWAEPDALCQWQLRALRQTCARASSNSPFYRAAFARLPQTELAAGRWPRDFGQFATAPFTLPEDLAAGWSDFLCVGLGNIARMVSLETSGSTDQPKRIAFSAADLERIVDYFCVGIAEMVRREDRVLVLLPGAERPGGVSRLLLAALERLGAAGVAASHPVENAEEFAGELAAFRPHCLVASPFQLRVLARSEKLAGLCAQTLRTILSCTAPLDAELRRQLTAAWNVRIYEYYGMTESGYGGGVECSAGDGYTTRVLKL